MSGRYFYSFCGFLLGLFTPVVWLASRLFLAHRKIFSTWFAGEMNHHSDVYIAFASVAVVAFSVIGYLIGQVQDATLEESETLKDANLELQRKATTDGLTGLFNAGYIRELLDVELENAYRSPLTCLLVDIDHFKKINDQHGHPFGDEVLKTVARILLYAIRRVDAAGRLGGEEFLVLLPNTPQDRAMIVAERIRLNVEAETFVKDDKSFHATVSLGVVSYPNPSLKNKTDLLKAVDEALYAAKKSGRNRTVVWAPTDSGPT